MLEREVALYLKLLPHLGNVTFATYGDARDFGYGDSLGPIRIICNRWRLPHRWYARLLSHLYPLLLRGMAVFKSNQIQGADIALKAARFSGKKFIARCGYLLSEFMERQHGLDSPEAQRARALEREVFTAADRVVVTTLPMQHAVVQRYQIPSRGVSVIPNYVETDLFRPNGNGHRLSRSICFVGRLEEQKNPLALLEAIKGMDVELSIVGNGPLFGLLRREVDTNGLRVRFLGNVPHRQLPEILNSSSLFVLPSHYEGHPKVLLEAMACGMAVIGANVPGTRELIVHGETGYLCDTSPEGIGAAIRALLADADLRARMGRNAREYVVKDFALGKIVEMELSLLQELVK